MIKAEQVKQLRERTGAGMMDCKKALTETDCDFDKATIYLREHGLAVAARKAGRATKDGRIEAYIHPGAKLGVLVEVNCETDFVAKTEDYQNLCRELAMQVAATNPIYVNKEDVPQEKLDQETEILKHQALAEGKPEKIVEKIIAGRIVKYYEEVCLLEQPYIREPEKKVNDLVKECIAKLGENMVVRRFIRFQLGEEA